MFKVDGFGAGCFGLLLIGILIPIGLTFWYFA